MFAQRIACWTRHGSSFRAAAVLAAAEWDTEEQVTRLGKSYFDWRANRGEMTLGELGRQAGWPAPATTPARAIAKALTLSVADPDEALEAAGDAIRSLRRFGFVIRKAS
jgi:CxxC motif-containing protein (DUF1111 family)